MRPLEVAGALTSTANAFPGGIAAPHMSDEAIAIVGASCRFPGAVGLEAFWRLLVDGIDAVSEIGAERWSTRFFYHPRRGEPGKTYSFAAGLIDDIDQFEPGFFGISPALGGGDGPATAFAARTGVACA